MRLAGSVFFRKICGGVFELYMANGTNDTGAVAVRDATDIAGINYVGRGAVEDAALEGGVVPMALMVGLA